ncbi:MAG: C4-dicarboxylate TRAP transporter substrate-binding protein [Sphaerochaetaceae bacterium]
MKKIVTLALVVLMSIGVVWANGTSEKAKKAGPYEVKFSTENGAEDIESKALYEIKGILNASGLFKCEVFIGGALGANDDTLEQAIQGAPIVTVSDPGRLMSFVKDFGVIQMPYIFDDISVINKLMDTDLYKSWEKEFESQGVKILSSNWYSGPRNFVLNKEINSPADLKGQKIRTIGSPVFTGSVNAMGATATPMSWSEVYSGIEQKAIDGCEAQTPTVYASHINEVCKYINKTEHFLLIGCPVIGTKTFDSWSKEAQDLFIKTFRDVGVKYQGLIGQMIADEEKEMASKGMIIHEVNQQLFKDAVEPVYAQLGYSDLRKEIVGLLKTK